MKFIFILRDALWAQTVVEDGPFHIIIVVTG